VLLLWGWVIRREHAVVPVSMLLRRRHEIGEPIEELKRRELDDAFGPDAVDFRDRLGPIQSACLCRGST
jgi:hypothetical protein